ncbi:MAG TPA: hypothetical protein VIL77_16620 [Gaiellaceae bacterium]
MTAVMRLEHAVTPEDGRIASWRGTAFGLEVRAGAVVHGVAPLPAEGGPGRVVHLELEQANAVKEGVRGAARTSLLLRRFDDGRPMLTIDRYEGLGYGIAAPRHGRSLVSPDGMRVRSAPTDASVWRSARLLFAQVLPLAATLQGLELLHASAVVVGGMAYGFVAPSGTGKTSLAVNLAARGAELFTDDVLAVDVSAPRVTAYPGARLVSVVAREFDALDAEEQRRLGYVVDEADKVQLISRPASASAPLAALYFLRRDSERGGQIGIRPGAATDPRLLLGARFITYLTDPDQLLAHLDATARIASDVATFLVDIPRGRGAREVADIVADHLAGGGEG